MRRVIALLLPTIFATLLAACSGDEKPPPASEATSNAPTAFEATRQATFQTQVANRTPVPSRTPIPTRTPIPRLTESDLPVPAWTRVDDDFFRLNPEVGTNVVLDTQSGDVFGLGPDRLYSEDGFVRIVTWSAKGDILITASLFSPTGSVGQTYIGRPFEAFEPFADFGSFSSAAFSPDGRLLALGIGSETLVVEISTRRIVLHAPPGQLSSGSWSSDGAYLALERRTTGSERIDVVRLSDGAIVTLDGWGVAWSGIDHWLAYVDGHLGVPGGQAIKAINLDTGIEVAAGNGSSPLRWSPDNHYLAVSRFEVGSARITILDMRGVERPTVIRGAWLRDWVDTETLQIVANVCGSEDVATVQADGTQLTQLSTDRYEGYFAQLSPDRDRFVSAHYESNNDVVIRVKSLNSGEFEDYSVKPYWLTFYGSGDVWSPDGRFIILTIVGGREGACFPAPTPQVTSIEYP